MVHVGRDRCEQDVRPDGFADRRAADGTAGREHGPLTKPILLGLAWAAGCADALSYVLLGNVFTANMTGNTVLLGIALGRGDSGHAVRSGIALCAFSLGAVMGARVGRARAGFGLEACAISASAPLAGLASHLPAVATAAAAMGLQTATLRRRNRTGVKVTYLTGTITTLWARAVGDERDAGFALSVWLAYGVGAAAGVLAQSPFGRWAFLLPAAGVALAGAASQRVAEPIG